MHPCRNLLDLATLADRNRIITRSDLGIVTAQSLARWGARKIQNPLPSTRLNFHVGGTGNRGRNRARENSQKGGIDV